LSADPALVAHNNSVADGRWRWGTPSTSTIKRFAIRPSHIPGEGHSTCEPRARSSPYRATRSPQPKAPRRASTNDVCPPRMSGLGVAGPTHAAILLVLRTSQKRHYPLWNTAFSRLRGRSEQSDR
jgi:hypothetical protein